MLKKNKFSVKIRHSQVLLNSIKPLHTCGKNFMLPIGHCKGTKKLLIFFGRLLLQIGTWVDFSICISSETTWNITDHLNETQVNSVVTSNIILNSIFMSTKCKRFVTTTICSTFVTMKSINWQIIIIIFNTSNSFFWFWYVSVTTNN